MDTMENAPAQPVGGRRTMRRRGMVAAAVAAGLAAGATGVAMADDGTGSPTPTPSASSGDRGPAPGGRHKGMGMGEGGRHGFGLMGGRGALHGEFVVPKAGGGYQTVEVQRGEVTAVSRTAVTLKSDDGFSQTYRVTDGTLVNSGRDGITSIEVGEQVSVSGVKNGDGIEAVRVADLTQMQHLRGRFAPPPTAPPSTPSSSS